MTKERSPQECPVCHRAFTPKRRGQVYCSLVCKRTVGGVPSQVRTERECPTCGKVFLQKRLDQVYCSHICHYGHDERWKAALTPRACLRCHQIFTPSKKDQRFCSPLCQRGHALSRTSTHNIHSPEVTEAQRQRQLQKVAEGTHPFLRSPVRKRAKEYVQHSHPKPAPTAPVPESLRELPPLPDFPDIPDEDNTDEEALLQNSEDAQPLTLPLLGEEARHEWQTVGAMRESQADTALTADGYHSSDGRTIVLSGQGSYLGVEGFALIVHQGRTHGIPAPERELLQPALHGVKRIIWVAAHGHQAGTLTLASAEWCRREGIHLTALDGSGMPLLEIVPEKSGAPQDTELQRRQWLISSGIVLPGSHSASQIAYEVVKRKIEQQYHTLLKHTELPGQQAGIALFETWRAWLELRRAYPIDYLRKLEGRLAVAYFRTWENWSLTWNKTDVKRIPPHWLVVRSRTSPLSGNGRHSVDPLNSALNYLYSCLASQCRQALLAENFSLTAGFLHFDKPGRDSLTWDLAELERGTVDDLLLKFLNKTILNYSDFAREESGRVRVHPQLARLLLAECRVPQDHVNAHARWLKSLLFTSPRRDDTTAPARY